VQVKSAIERGRNSWLGMESLCCDSGIIRFAESSTAYCDQSGSHSRSGSKTIPHLHPLPFGKGEASSNAGSPEARAAAAAMLDRTRIEM
jgi:hypothetical protein